MLFEAKISHPVEVPKTFTFAEIKNREGLYTCPDAPNFVYYSNGVEVLFISGKNIAVSENVAYAFEPFKGVLNVKLSNKGN